MINTNKIKGRMAELQITQKYAANSSGLAQPAVNQKISNICLMDLEQAEKLSDLLHINHEDFVAYFFTDRVAQRKLEEGKTNNVRKQAIKLGNDTILYPILHAWSSHFCDIWRRNLCGRCKRCPIGS